MSKNQPGGPEPEQAAPHSASTTEEPAAVAGIGPDDQSPTLPDDQDAGSAPRRFVDVIHRVRQELLHDIGHAISLIALHVIALGILDKTPLLALLALR